MMCSKQLIDIDKESYEISDDIESNDSDQTETENIDNYPTIDKLDLTSKEKIYYNMANKYFLTLDAVRVKLMVDIINSESKISLRLLDWFVTKYSQKYNIRCGYSEYGKAISNIHMVSVNISYKAQLKSYRKRYFDPFKRNNKYKFQYHFKSIDKKIVVNIGQLNFFKWAFSNGIIDYVLTNFETLTKAMSAANYIAKIRKENKKSEKKENKNIEETVVTKNGINIKAKKQKFDNEIKLVLSFN